jgi:hypothetical protein
VRGPVRARLESGSPAASLSEILLVQHDRDTERMVVRILAEMNRKSFDSESENGSKMGSNVDSMRHLKEVVSFLLVT